MKPNDDSNVIVVTIDEAFDSKVDSILT